jgi:hypothetical protein
MVIGSNSIRYKLGKCQALGVWHFFYGKRFRYKPLTLNIKALSDEGQIESL